MVVALREGKPPVLPLLNCIDLLSKRSNLQHDSFTLVVRFLWGPHFQPKSPVLGGAGLLSVWTAFYP